MGKGENNNDHALFSLTFLQIDDRMATISFASVSNSVNLFASMISMRRPILSSSVFPPSPFPLPHSLHKSLFNEADFPDVTFDPIDENRI
jgi:hypothetical protein